MAEVKEPTLLDRLEEQRTRKHEAWAEFIDRRETERATFEARVASDEFKSLPEEQRKSEYQSYTAAEEAFKDGSLRHKTDLDALDERVDDQREISRRREEARLASAGTDARVVSEPLTYRRDNSRQYSYYSDLAAVHGPGITLQTGGTRDQRQARLIRHGQEMDVEMPKRAQAREKRALEQVRAAETTFLMQHRDPKVDRLLAEMRNSGALTHNPFERRVTPNLADGTGGYFSPPLWLIDEYIPGLRAHRVAANLARQMDLPPGTASINIPKLSTLTAVGYQQLNNSALPSQDWTDTYVQANVKTIGGYSDVALQLLELSPGAIIDEVVTTDLMAAYNQFLGAQFLLGDASNAATLNGGHLTGLYPYTNWGMNNITWTDGSPSGQHFVSALAVMASKVSYSRFSLQSYATVMHGRRWWWYTSSPDTTGRPLGETQAGGPFNAAAVMNDGLEAEGLVGRLPFLGNTGAYIDANFPTTDNTDGGGATRDIAISGNWDDAWLFEGPLHTDVFREVLSGTLGVRFRIYGYAASLVRYGQSFSILTGTGMVPPVGAVASLTF